jgi:hypothetical protein
MDLPERVHFLSVCSIIFLFLAIYSLCYSAPAHGLVPFSCAIDLTVIKTIQSN